MTQALQIAPAQSIIEKYTANSNMTVSERAEAAIELAEVILREANRIQSKEEKTAQAQLARMMDDPKGKIFTTCMTDECFRSEDNQRIAEQICYLLEKHGTPQYLNFMARLQMGAFKVLGRPMANMLIPLVKDLIRKETKRVIIPGEAHLIENHISKRKKEGITTNLNHLGEAILGESEAKKRLQSYITDLKKKSVEYTSVKISTICSQLNTLSWDETLDLLAERLRILYRTAMENPYTAPDGSKYAKFVNLDMEEYRDLHLTADQE